jgi:hypothetical protein
MGRGRVERDEEGKNGEGWGEGEWRRKGRRGN